MEMTAASGSSAPAAASTEWAARESVRRRPASRRGGLVANKRGVGHRGGQGGRDQKSQAHCAGLSLVGVRSVASLSYPPRPPIPVTRLLRGPFHCNGPCVSRCGGVGSSPADSRSSEASLQLGEPHAEVVQVVLGGEAELPERRLGAALEPSEQAGLGGRALAPHPGRQARHHRAALVGSEITACDEVGHDALRPILRERGSADGDQDRLLDGLAR